MLKVWIWKKLPHDSTCRVSPNEPEKQVDHEMVYYFSPNDIMVCCRYIKRITGRVPTLKPRAHWFTAADTKPPTV